MFTIKLYRDDGFRQRIHEADDFTILRTGLHPDAAPVSGWVEITAHRKNGEDFRFDVGDSPSQPSGGVWERAIIENAAGRTTEIIGRHPPQGSLQNA